MMVTMDCGPINSSLTLTCIQPKRPTQESLRSNVQFKMRIEHTKQRQQQPLCFPFVFSLLN